MPYIEQRFRDRLDEKINDLAKELMVVSVTGGKAGLMNYTITRLLHRLYEMDYPSYDKINSAIGVLECAKQELYRKKAAPYEDEKIKENGDV